MNARLETMKALLAKHEPTPDDARVGHTYRFTKADDRIRMTWKDRAKALLSARLRRMG